MITRYLATLLEASRIDSLMTMDVHDQAAFDNAFRIPTRHLESAPLFVEHFSHAYQGEALVVVSPDLGGIKRAERFRQVLEQRLGQPIGRGCVEKYRCDEHLSGSMLVGNVDGCSVILVDDLISTSSTLLRAAEACRAGGARSIQAMVIHGLFTTGTRWLENPLFERVVISDSITPPRPERLAHAVRLEVLDISAEIAMVLAAQYGTAGPPTDSRR